MTIHGAIPPIKQFTYQSYKTASIEIDAVLCYYMAVVALF